MNIQNIEVDGRLAWLVLPTGKPRGAVVVCHGGSGLEPHERTVLERLAARGHAAIAPDLFGERPADRAAFVAMLRQLVGEPTRLRARVRAAIDRVREHGPVAVVGHCFGGTAALEAARDGEAAGVACAVSLHGGLAAASPATPATRMTARVLACCGAADPHCPPEQRAAFEQEMTAAGADWQLHVYGGVLHGFTVQGSERSPGCAYDARADRRSWAATTALLDEALGG
jgi:dienelactone hydrolase